MVRMLVSLTALAAVLAAALAGCCIMAKPPDLAVSLDPRFRQGPLLYADDFTGDLSRWVLETEKPGHAQAGNGRLDLQMPAGCTVWFKQKLTGPIIIQYEATMPGGGGPAYRVSDLNCFWMANDTRSPDDLLATTRSGKFSDYDLLKTYYVGLGGNTNTTTRFRRYIGDTGNRPLDPKNDLRDPADLLVADHPNKIQLVACDHLIQYYRDGKKLFEMVDPDPYRTGWFGFRTTASHMVVQDFRVYQLE